MTLAIQTIFGVRPAVAGFPPARSAFSARGQAQYHARGFGYEAAPPRVKAAASYRSPKKSFASCDAERQRSISYSHDVSNAKRLFIRIFGTSCQFSKYGLE